LSSSPRRRSSPSPWTNPNSDPNLDLHLSLNHGFNFNPNPNPNTNPNPNPNQATAFAMDCIPRTLSRGQSFDALSSQAYVYIYSSQATTAGRRPNPSLTPDPHS